MDEQTQRDLEQLRSSILQDIIPLVENSAFDPLQKFTLLMSAARVSEKASDFKLAYKAAVDIKDEAEKADALFALLEEIDIQLQDISFTDNGSTKGVESKPTDENTSSEPAINSTT